MAMFDDEILKAPKPAERAEAERTAGSAASARASEHRMLQLQRAVGNSGVAQLLRQEDEAASVRQVVGSGGQALDDGTRTNMESAFGHDFSSVRVHTGGEAASSAQRLGAHAYTVGDDIVFGEGRYDPASHGGQRTLAHELTHVVQQRSGPVEGTDNGSGVRVSDPGDRFERAAEATADQVMAGRMASGEPASVSAGAAVQREEAPEEEEPVQAMAVQREEESEEEPVQALAVQREEAPEEEEPVQAMAVQREEAPEEEEPVQAMAVQREEAPEEEMAEG